MSDEFVKRKDITVHLPSKIKPGESYEHKLRDESELYKDREFVNMRIKNLEEQLEEQEMSMALAIERYDIFIKAGKNEDDDNIAEAAAEMMEEINKEYELAKEELSKLRSHLSTLE